MNITLGTDPEFHIISRATGFPVSSFKLLKGQNKHKPIDLSDGAKMYSDNVLVECSFPPTNSVNSMLIRMREVFLRMQAKLGEGYQLLPKAACFYDPDQLDSVEVWEAGCNPNHNAYTGDLNLPASFTNEMRTGSFHVHIGNEMIKSDPPDDMGDMHLNEVQMQTVKLLDIILGSASVVFDKDDSSALRRSLYGRAGECRPTPYGIEYRVLGPWALRSPETTELVWDIVNYAMQQVLNRSAKDIISSVGETWAQLAINDNDMDCALMSLKRAGVGWKLMDRIKKDYGNINFNQSWGIQ